MFIRSPNAAAAVLHLLLVVVPAISTTARAQVVLLPNCNFQEVDLMPCMAAGGGPAAAAGNISDACCSSLNKALDAGHRCVCSLLLSNGVFASLVTNLLTLPLVLPLPGCFLYAPSLAACQAADERTACSSLCSYDEHGGGAGAVVPSPTQVAAAAAAATPVNKRAGRGQADDGRMRGSVGDGSSEAPSAAVSVSRSDACQRTGSDEGRAYVLTFAVAIAVFWFNHVIDS